jgi:hypothetical protein
MHTVPFLEIVQMQMRLYILGDPVQTIDPTLVRGISKYMHTVVKHLPRQYTTMTLTAVLVSFLVTGFTVDTIQIFPKIHRLDELAPAALVLYGKIAGVQCRTMSNATRALKAIISVNGYINNDFIFKLA